MDKVDVCCCVCGEWAAEVEREKANDNYLCYDCTYALEEEESE